MATRLRKSPRLKDFDYVGPYAYSLTFVTRQRSEVFQDASLVQLVELALLRACAQHSFDLHAYCFMPDHLHVLVSGGADSRLTDFVRLFKQLSGYAAKQKLSAPLWQISYYDHVLRREEDLAQVARYIWSNPVRAGLVDDFRQYPYAGPRPLLED
ncbi:MAG: hypothetical protein A2148_05790 [Chloroflexi bacterium RBG_16_68_14]|nr:MAG: hypothetical protein A2148_05790 [Chloroflexi bacterium RBG_16_68_14]